LLKKKRNWYGVPINLIIIPDPKVCQGTGILWVGRFI